jgi:protein-S-isoprenylcysteine O-methyltransferase Ste14
MSMRLLRHTLRPAFAVCLLASQFLSGRSTYLTGNVTMEAAGALLALLGILLFAFSSLSLRRAQKANAIARGGPYAYLRHPIYASIYVFSIGLGLLFYSWIWFAVLAGFIPLWFLEAREEEKEMIRSHGTEYVLYQARTGMFFPRLT